MKKILLLPLAFLFLITNSQAQDTIIKKNGDIIKAKIIEVASDEVKFSLFGEVDSPTITLKKNELKKVKVKGQTIFDNDDSDNKESDVIVKKNGDVLNVKVLEIGTSEVKFKLEGDENGPVVTVEKSEIKNMKVAGQTIIDIKGGAKEDIITKKDGSILRVKVLNLGADDITFKLVNNPDGPTMSIKKSEVDLVKVDGQVVYKYEEDPRSISNNSILNKTNCLKFYFFSPLNKHLAFGYEWMQKPGFNWDAGLGIVGVGTSITDAFVTRNPTGTFIRFGPKFLLGSSSDIEIEGAKYAHPLKGRYIKVEMILSALKVKSTVDTNGYFFPNPTPQKYSYVSKYQSMSLNVGYGRQFILGNTITIGYYIGVGYSLEAKSTDLIQSHSYWDSESFTRYSHTYFGENFPLITTARFTIGYIFNSETLFNKKGKTLSKAPSRNSMME